MGLSILERTSRLQTIDDLGPADMCVIQKTNPQTKKVEVSTFLYYTGVDTSNSASIAAHLQALATLISSKSQHWYNEKKHWKVHELTYCCYNAFSKVDMRVTVHIPGQFESVVVASNGKIVDNLNEKELEQLWLETLVSAMVRCLLDTEADEANKVGGLVEIRRDNPFTQGQKISEELLSNFLDGFERLFWDGAKLGCGVDSPKPSIVYNYLVEGFLRCIQLTQKYTDAVQIVNRLETQNSAVAVLKAKLLLMKDEEIQAVQVMSERIKDDDRDAEMLLVEAQFLLDKKKPELALHLAKQAVQLSPSDFKAWATLVSVYTKLNDFENALLSLNSCPVNAQRENFSLKRVVTVQHGAENIHLPSPIDVALEQVTDLLSATFVAEQKALDQNLAYMPAANLKSTFAAAYDLLTEIALKTGWEKLLKHRAHVFVMEEEYRKDRSNGQSKRESRIDVAKAEKSKQAEDGEKDEKAVNGEIVEKDEKAENGKKSIETDLNDETVSHRDDSSTLAMKSPVQSRGKEIESESQLDYKKKRLCERWLDNLFMLLYEDLRVYTMWQAEYVRLQAQQTEYKRSSLEWEILGLLAFRLKHYKEGSLAFSNALKTRFAAKAQREMLRFYEMERTKIISKSNTIDSGNGRAHNDTSAKTVHQLNEKILHCCIKLLVWNHRWYNDFLPSLIGTVADLVAKEGLIKIQSIVQAAYSDRTTLGDGVSNHGVIELMDKLFEFYKEYKLQGTDN